MSSPQTLSRGNCSAYGAAAKTDENWTTISDKAERRRVQNRIAQRAYRQKLKERLHLLERRAAELQTTGSFPVSYTNGRPTLHPHHSTGCYDEECYATMSTSSNSSFASDDASYNYHRHSPYNHSRAGTASPPTMYHTQYATAPAQCYSGQPSPTHIMSRSPAFAPQQMAYYAPPTTGAASYPPPQVPSYAMHNSPSEMMLSYSQLTDEINAIDMSYMQSFEGMPPLIKFEEPGEMQYLNC